MISPRLLCEAQRLCVGECMSKMCAWWLCSTCMQVQPVRSSSDLCCRQATLHTPFDTHTHTHTHTHIRHSISLKSCAPPADSRCFCACMWVCSVLVCLCMRHQRVCVCVCVCV